MVLVDEGGLADLHALTTDSSSRLRLVLLHLRGSGACLGHAGEESAISVGLRGSKASVIRVHVLLITVVALLLSLLPERLQLLSLLLVDRDLVFAGDGDDIEELFVGLVRRDLLLDLGHAACVLSFLFLELMDMV